MQRSRRGDQNDARAAALGCFRDSVAHFAAGAVAEEADRVDGFASASGGDEDDFAGEIVGVVEDFEGGANDLVVFGEPSAADHAAGEIAAAGRDDPHAALLEGLKIGLGCGMLPHVDVHRRGDDHGRLGGEIEGGQKIVGDAVGEFGEDVGRGGSDDEQVGGLRRVDVLDG